MSFDQAFCPYAGLQPYTELEQKYFFGREQDQEIIGANLVAAPLTILYGASGVGKTSVLLAGVVPFLRKLPDVLVVVHREWQDRTFLASLKDRIAGAVSERTGQPFAVEDSSLDELLARAARETHSTLAIVFDQFEEYFLYHPESEAGNRFDAEFARAVNRDDNESNFLLSMREDSLALLDRFQGRIPNLFDNYLRMEYLDHEAARAAIEKPIEQYNRLRAEVEQVSIDPALVEAVLVQVRTGQVTLGDVGRGAVGAGPASVQLASPHDQIETPYLQLVMTRLWDEEMRAGWRVLRLATLERLGGAKRIVRTRLDEVMSALPVDEQDVAARIFHHLVTPSGAKIAHTDSDLAEYAELPRTRLADVLVTLSRPDVRVLRPLAPSSGQSQEPRYEIFHDVLAPAILDWRARFLQARERATLEKRVQRARLGALALALFAIVVLAIVAFGALRQAERVAANSRVLQQVLAGNFNDEFVKRAMTGTTSFCVDATPLGCTDSSGNIWLKYEIYPDASSVPAGLDSVEKISYIQRHPSLPKTLAAAGASGDFMASYYGWGRLSDVTAVIEYKDRLPSVVRFDMIKAPSGCLRKGQVRTVVQ